MPGLPGNLMCDSALNAIPPIGTGKKCKRCHEIKKLPDFHMNKACRDKHQPNCKKCINKASHQWHVENKLRRAEKGKEWRTKNKEIISAKKRIAYARDKEKVKIYGAQRYKENKDHASAYQKQWRENHPEKRKLQGRKAAVKRLSMPKGRLNNAIRSAIRRSLHGVKAGRKWEILVGYTIDQLKKHLERQFTLEMTWENYGPFWHVDHKIPISAFNFEKPEDIDFKHCWGLKNLQPLEADQNRMKHDKTERPFQPSLII